MAASVRQRTASASVVPASRRKIQGTLVDVSVRSAEMPITGINVLTAICSARWAEARSVATRPSTLGSYTSLIRDVYKRQLLTVLINWGGWVGNVASGILYLMSVWLGYAQPDVAGAVHDYGTKFLVTAGLLNLLAIADAFEIARGRKS